MRLINNNEVVIFFFIIAVAINDFIKTSIADKSAIFVFYLEITESVLPVASNCWRKYYKNTSIVAICCNKSLSNHSGYNCLTKTDNVGDKTTAMLHHDIITLYHGIALVSEIVIIIRQLRNKIVFNLVAEVVDEHTHIQLVWGRLFLAWSEMRLTHYIIYIIQSHRNGVFP